MWDAAGAILSDYGPLGLIVVGMGILTWLALTGRLMSPKQHDGEMENLQKHYEGRIEEIKTFYEGRLADMRDRLEDQEHETAFWREIAALTGELGALVGKSKLAGGRRLSDE